MPHARVGDIDVSYELVDYTEPWKPAPAPLLFIHGLGGDRSFWLSQVPAFCRHYPVLTVDLRGHGRSSKPDANWTLAEMARDVVRLLRALGAERAHVVGCSLGGMVAQQLALDYPQAVASLVLVDTWCGTPPGFEPVGQEMLRFIEDHTMAEVARVRITNAFSETVDPVMRDHLIDRVAQNDKTAYLRSARAAFSFAVRNRLGEIAMPTLVIVGEQDRVTPPVLSEELASRISGARLERISGAGHISNMERPSEFNRIVSEFLAGI